MTKFGSKTAGHTGDEQDGTPERENHPGERCCPAEIAENAERLFKREEDGSR